MTLQYSDMGSGKRISGATARSWQDAGLRRKAHADPGDRPGGVWLSAGGAKIYMPLGLDSSHRFGWLLTGVGRTRAGTTVDELPLVHVGHDRVGPHHAEPLPARFDRAPPA